MRGRRLDIADFLTATLEHGPSTIDQLRFSHDGRWLATSSQESVVVWDVTCGQRHATIAGAYNLVSVDETSLIVSDGDATTIWDVSATRKTHTISGFTAYAITKARDRLVGIDHRAGRHLQTRRLDGTVVLSADASLEALRACHAPLEGAIEGEPMPGFLGTRAEADNLSVHIGPEGLAVSPDGRRIGLVSGGHVFLFDGESGTVISRLSTLTQRDVTAVDLTHDMVAFVTMGGTLALHGADDGCLWIQEGIGAELRSVHVAPSGRSIAITCWDPYTTTLLFALSGQGNGLAPAISTGMDDDSWRARFSSVDDVVAVGSDHGAIRLFRLPSRADAIMSKVEQVDDALEWVAWAFTSHQHPLLVDLAKEMHARFDNRLTPEQRGWLGHFEYQGFYHQQRWHEAWDVLTGLESKDYVLTPRNQAFRYSMGVEIAFHLAKIGEIPLMADECIRIREEVGDDQGVSLCRQMTSKYLKEAGRPDLAARYSERWTSRLVAAFKRFLPGRG